MELWVRSQDKMKLVNNCNLYISNEIRNEYVIEDLNNKYLKLGTYKTKERALEVLTEIQNKINLINLGHDFGSPMVDLKNPTYIYQMPEN